MLRYPGQFKDDYCLAKVIKAEPDEDNLVRKVTVTYKKKNPRESLSICKSKPMISEEVAIHRLHRLQLVDDEFVGKIPGAVDHGLAGVIPQAVAGYAGYGGSRGMMGFGTVCEDSSPSDVSPDVDEQDLAGQGATAHVSDGEQVGHDDEAVLSQGLLTEQARDDEVDKI